jgi:hypothetical protein
MGLAISKTPIFSYHCLVVQALTEFDRRSTNGYRPVSNEKRQFENICISLSNANFAETPRYHSGVRKTQEAVRRLLRTTRRFWKAETSTRPIQENRYIISTLSPRRKSIPRDPHNTVVAVVELGYHVWNWIDSKLKEKWEQTSTQSVGLDDCARKSLKSPISTTKCRFCPLSSTTESYVYSFLRGKRKQKQTTTVRIHTYHHPSTVHRDHLIFIGMGEKLHIHSGRKRE